MFKYILVPATGLETDAAVFATALAVARMSGAHLEFLHVRVDVQKTLMAMAANDLSGGAGYDQIIESLEQDVASRQQKAEQAFREFCERERVPISGDPTTDPPSAEWRMETGDEPAWLAEHGRAADLLVVGRAREGEAVAMGVLESALLASGRPVLIAPTKVPDSLIGHRGDRLEGPSGGRARGSRRAAVREHGGSGAHPGGGRRRRHRRAMLRTTAPCAVLAEPQNDGAAAEVRWSSRRRGPAGGRGRREG